MLHRSSDYATVTNNTAYGNLDAGLALYESSNCEVTDNRFYYNKCETFSRGIIFTDIILVVPPDITADIVFFFI